MRRLLLVLPLLVVACVSAKRQERSIARSDLGTAYLEEGSTESAIETLRHAVKSDPRNWLAWNHLGLAYMAKGRPVEAERAFKNAVQRGGAGRGEVHLNYGLFLFAQGRVPEAVTQYEKALEDLEYRKPALVLNNLGYALHTLGEHDRAATVLVEAVERAPNLCQARFNLGLVETARQRDAAALDRFEEVIQLCPDESVGSLFQAGSLYLQAGRNDRAGDYLNEVISRVPGTEIARTAEQWLAEAGL